MKKLRSPAVFGRVSSIAFAAAATLAAAIAFAAANDPPPKKEATRVQKTERIKPDGITEHCVTLLVGQVVRYRFEAEAPLDFNIHAHQGETVITAVQQEAVARSEFVDFKPDRPADWCWMWTNKNATPTEVRYTMFVAPPKREKKK